MSASRLLRLSLDDEDWSSPGDHSAGIQPTSSTSTTSGEFNSFVSIGTSAAGGGGQTLHVMVLAGRQSLSRQGGYYEGRERQVLH